MKKKNASFAVSIECNLHLKLGKHSLQSVIMIVSPSAGHGECKLSRKYVLQCVRYALMSFGNVYSSGRYESRHLALLPCDVAKHLEIFCHVFVLHDYTRRLWLVCF